jgi:hypothetical protein
VIRRPPLSPESRRLVGQTVVAVLLLAVGTVGYIHAAPWILPLRVVEGPLIQLVTPTSAAVVWFTSRPAECTFELTAEGARPTVTIESRGRRHVARLAGLTPDTAYAYTIYGGRRLAGDTLRSGKTVEQPIRFIVFGDSGKGKPEQFHLVPLMRAAAPDFLVHTGDVVYPDGARGRYSARFFAPYRALLSRVALWPSLGNHDVDDRGAAGPYLDVFELPANGPAGTTPGHHYWFDQGPARFAVLDSNVPGAELRDRVAPWLREVLGDAAPRWRFVVMHHPPYSTGRYRPSPDILAELVPVFEEAGVDVVFAGHDHNYQRSQGLRGGAVVAPNEGVHYVISGAGGARLYELQEPRSALFAAAYDRQHGFTVVELAGDVLHLKQIVRDGTTVDEWVLDRAAAPD